MNKIHLIGNLTTDPRMSEASNGNKVCTFGLAVNRPKVKDQEEDADFFSIILFNGQAEACGKYLKKGKKVAVVGSISLKEWGSRDGKIHCDMNVAATDVEFLSPREA